ADPQFGMANTPARGVHAKGQLGAEGAPVEVDGLRRPADAQVGNQAGILVGDCLGHESPPSSGCRSKQVLPLCGSKGADQCSWMIRQPSRPWRSSWVKRIQALSISPASLRQPQ